MGAIGPELIEKNGVLSFTGDLFVFFASLAATVRAYMD